MPWASVTQLVGGPGAWQDKVGHPAQLWPRHRRCVWELWFHRILQHLISGQWLPTASAKGCPPRSCCYSPTRREGQPPNPPITATLGPVCGHEGQLGQARGGLLSQGHQQGKRESGLEGKAVLGEQGAGDTVSGRVGSEAPTPQWNKSLQKEGTEVWKAGVAAGGFLP